MAEADPIEQEIPEEERRLWEQERRVCCKWARRMGPLFWLGFVAFLLMTMAFEADAPSGMIVYGSISAVLNALSSYAIKKGSIVAPDKFPVRYLGQMGPVNGTNFSLAVALFSAIVVLFAFSDVWT